MHSNKNNKETKESETSENTGIVLDEKSDVKTYKFSRTLTISGLVVSVILLIIILILVYMYFCK